MNVIAIYKKIRNKKFVFKRNEKADILLLDGNTPFFAFEKYRTATVNLIEINLFYFIPQVLTSLFSRSFFADFKLKYLTRVFKSFDSKIAIGNHINGNIYLYKQCMPQNIAINYQLCRLLDRDFKVYCRTFRDKKLISNYFFVFDSFHAKMFSKIVESQFIIGGALKNNEIILEEKPKKYDVMYISEFRSLDVDNFYYVCHEFAVRLISEYCKASNKTFCIALSSGRKDKAIKISAAAEIDYYKKFAEFIVADEPNSYELAEVSNVCIAINSNLGSELLARKKKVLFLPLYVLFRDEFDPDFLPGTEGAFWYKGADKKAITDKIEKLLNMSTPEWESVLEASGIAMPFDPGNTQLKKLVDTIFDNKETASRFN